MHPAEAEAARRASLPAYLLQNYGTLNPEWYLGEARRVAQKEAEAEMSELVR